ncbi:aspartyl/asparaginyl beta-hydroxylase isoform X3 [Numida meleagris]|uniref:aspartyl/asparaginyl beta-hydroxylase isoform X3 n=1 Tax=Numida meleagris TaxID=8996 RepID=UPI000B3E2F63|nr:aspartyl/asparaginyl beta-hydroxylase isoform X3 [Numida meleagris]
MLPRSKPPATGSVADTRSPHATAAPALSASQPIGAERGHTPSLCALCHWLEAAGGRGGGVPGAWLRWQPALPHAALGRRRLLTHSCCSPAPRYLTGGAMASRKGSKGTGGTPGSGSKRESKHGGNKNGKKEGLSGSSFFTWFMVIALLGVWTSVAVVWFELVDYEEVLGKLGIYDADGDGDFDVEDAKVLLGLKERSVPEQPASPVSEETIQPAEQSFVKSEHKNVDVELEEEIQPVLHEALHSQPGEGHEDVDESITDQWQEKEEIHTETFEAPATDDLLRELENEMTEDYEIPDSLQKDADLVADDPGATEPERYEVPVSYEYDMDVENIVSDPEAPGDTELTLEDAVEHYTAVEDPPEEVHEATEPVRDEVVEDLEIEKKLPVESKHTEDNVATGPEESEVPVQTEDYSNDNLVGKGETETEQDKMEKVKKKKKPKLLNKFDKTIKAELDAAEKLRKKGKVEEALRAFEALVNQYPESPRARYGKAQSEDDLAEKMRSNEMLQKAINTYDEVVSLPNVPSDLIKLSLKREADRQQFLGRMRSSLITLQKLVHLFPSDTSFKNDLGVGYLLIGDNSNAKQVYEEVLRMAPDDGFAKVHYGFILKAENKIAESIPYLKEGLESGDPGTDDGRFYFHLGDALQRIGDKEAYKWYELGYQRGHFASVWQRSLYNVKGLKAQPWWTARETGYTELVKSLEKNWKLIRDEGLDVMDKKRSLFLPEDENLREKGDWSQFTLWQQGRKNENACKGVPKTCALLERFPEATGCRRGQIKYSVMLPGTHVWPHTGPTNCRLRMHLGLVIPKEGCRIRCAQENRTWEEGKVLIFDDSFEHEVWQDAESYRLIFIVDVWHPELTAQQRRTLPAI